MTDMANNLPANNVAAGPAVDPAQAEALRNEANTEVVKVVTAAHKFHNAYTDEVKKTIQNFYLLTFEETETDGGSMEEVAPSTAERPIGMCSAIWFNVAHRMNPAIRHVVEFAKRLPGFYSLTQDDQLILIKLGFFEVWLSRISRLSTPEYIVFDDGTTIHRAQLTTMYDASFANDMLDYIWTLMKLQVTEEEMAIYTGMLLMCPHRGGLNNPERINGLHRALHDAFQSIMTANNNGPEGVAVARARMAAFSEARLKIRGLGARHYYSLAWCRENWQILQLPALFSEVFDISKCEENPVPMPDSTVAKACQTD